MARVRGRLRTHTTTGNPLVDSVTEHQPADDAVFAVCSRLDTPLCWPRWPGQPLVVEQWIYFMVPYGDIAHHLSSKLSRLILICAPRCSIASGIWCGVVLDAIIVPFLLLFGGEEDGS